MFIGRINTRGKSAVDWACTCMSARLSWSLKFFLQAFGCIEIEFHSSQNWPSYQNGIDKQQDSSWHLSALSLVAKGLMFTKRYLELGRIPNPPFFLKKNLHSFNSIKCQLIKKNSSNKCKKSNIVFLQNSLTVWPIKDKRFICDRKKKKIA